MIVVRSETHRRHHSLELDGATIVPSWESRTGRSTLTGRLTRPGHEMIGPRPSMRNSLMRSATRHVPLLAEAWPRWQAEGHRAAGAMAFGWPGAGSATCAPPPSKPNSATTRLLRIVRLATAPGRPHARRCDRRHRGPAGPRRCAGRVARPAPGHHAMRDQFGGYCYSITPPSRPSGSVPADMGKCAPRRRLPPWKRNAGHLL